MGPLPLLALGLAASALAGDPGERLTLDAVQAGVASVRQAGWRPSIPVVIGGSAADRAELAAAARTLAARFPVLAAPELVTTIEFTAASTDPKAPPDCGYDDVRLRIHLQPGCLDLVRKDVEPGLYRPGTAVEALLFHELIHAWHISRDEKTDGDVTGEYEAGTGGRVMKVLDELQAWQKAWVGADADYYPAKEKKRLELVRAHRLPARGPGDDHAADHPGELYAYAGEFYFYASDPARWLTAAERAYWAAMGEHLAGRGPQPPAPKAP